MTDVANVYDKVLEKPKIVDSRKPTAFVRAYKPGSDAPLALYLDSEPDTAMIFAKDESEMRVKIATIGLLPSNVRWEDKEGEDEEDEITAAGFGDSDYTGPPVQAREAFDSIFGGNTSFQKAKESTKPFKRSDYYLPPAVEVRK